MMKMLYAGGLPVYADNHSSFETDKMLGLPHEIDWLEVCQGKAIKVLEPIKYKLPKTYPYRFIWMSRNPTDQAKSYAKFITAMTQQPPGTYINIKTLAKSFVSDKPKVMKLLQKYPQSKLIEVQFEHLIQQPLHIAYKLSAFCGGLDAEAMAKVIAPRTTGVYNGLLEIEQLRFSSGEAEPTEMYGEPTKRVFHLL